ncbi:PLP-dependent aminotransferase family protein [uncultured Caulobacter sp.]|uniref:aminotransferase-like domain-containing protein n=1 Tax=uncultured Caulobacter sp. TaxID=158749 RepID=UPI0026248A6C|nr:PLP-dependent aminotransferase family protein [uncultured Caulobacter sp.]
MSSPWTPVVPEGSAPLYERLVAALRADIASGALAAGTRLPPQRDLAYRLGVGLGTVTRAYVEAEKAGLVSAHVGRGSFVNAPAEHRPYGREGPINLAQNIAPAGPAATRIAEALARLRRRPDLLEHLAYAPAAGHEAQRRAGAKWLAMTGGFAGADWRRIVCCGGAQQGLAFATAAVARAGDTVLCEASTYGGVKALAAHAGWRLKGVAMDAEGLDPDALEAAIRATGARVLSTIPTLQNPTGRIMSLARRQAIVVIARRHDLTIVEDDVYGVYVPNAPPPLALLAPERTFHVTSVSKTLGPGLRAGFLVAPTAEAFERVLSAVGATTYAPSGFGGLVATQWIEDGAAETIVAEVRAEAAARLAIAREVLGEAIETPRSDTAPHVWLPMGELAAERLSGRALRGGAEVTPPDAPGVEPGLESGVRVCLGAVADQQTLRRGLEIVAAALSSEVGERSRAVI